MKKYFALFLSFSFSISSVFAQDNIYSGATVESESATVIEFNSPATVVPLLTPWELIHRTALVDGFTWTGVIASYITPSMYEGTPFGNNQLYRGDTNPHRSLLEQDPKDYNSCLEHEVYLSFGLGERIENTDIRELKAIAKVCAQQFYGTYFDGKSYTTREEYLMALLTLFSEGVYFDGTFTDNGMYREGDTGGVDSGFSNISPKAWYAPYLAHAKKLELIGGEQWDTGTMISDTEATEILAGYTALRMNFTGNELDRGIISTQKMRYNIAFPDAHSPIIRIQ